MTQPQAAAPKATQPRKAPAKKPAPVTDIAEKAAAKESAKATRPATASKQQPKTPATKAPEKAAPARVAPLPKEQWKLPAKPAALTWETKEAKGVEYHVAEGACHNYRLWQGEGGDWFAAQKLKQGSWSPMAGVCKTIDDAKTLAGWNEAGALWLAYRDMVGMPFEKLLQDYE